MKKAGLGAMRITQGVITPRDSSSVKILLDDIRKYKVFSPEEEREAFLTYASNKDPRLLNEIVKRNVRFVVSVAKKFLSSNNSFEDLISAGLLGLTKAVIKFDPNQGFKFSSFAVWDIRAEIMAYIANNSRIVRIPVSAQTKIKAIEAKILNNEELTYDEKSMISSKNETSAISLETSYNQSDFILIDVVENTNADNPLTELFREDKVKFISIVLNKLKEREAYIIQKTFGLNGMKAVETIVLAEELGVSRTRVEEIRRNALFKLKKHIQSKSFKQSYITVFSE